MAPVFVLWPFPPALLAKHAPSPPRTQRSFMSPRILNTTVKRVSSLIKLTITACFNPSQCVNVVIIEQTTLYNRYDLPIRKFSKIPMQVENSGFTHSSPYSRLEYSRRECWYVSIMAAWINMKQRAIWWRKSELALSWTGVGQDYVSVILIHYCSCICIQCYAPSSVPHISFACLFFFWASVLKQTVLHLTNILWHVCLRGDVLYLWPHKSRLSLVSHYFP